MGNSNTSHIEYLTKDGIQISYIFWDLKGKNRFPQPPGDTEVNFMLQRCLDQINASSQQIKEIKQFNSKYKYRFVILHKRKVAQARKQLQLQNLRRSSLQLHQVQQIKIHEQKSKTKDLQDLMKDVQLNQTLIKVALMKIDKYIAEKFAHNQFIAIKGLERLMQLLQKAIKINNNGTKTNFSNQIQLLKFIRFFSYRYPKQFYNYIPKIKNYASIIIKTYHPVNTHITAYCLNLLTDYVWRVEEGDHIVKVLQFYRLQQNYESFLTPFADTINQTDSILMVYYNLKFINELIAAVIQQDKKQMLKQNMAFVKYGYILDGVKSKLQQSYYNLQNATFISMHQKIFKHATKDKKSKKVIEQNRVSVRNTLNISALHEQILLSFLQSDNQNNQQDENQQNPNEQIVVAYLAESDRKTFNKFILDTLTQIQKYTKLQYYLENSTQTNQSQQQTQQIVQSKIISQNLQTYIGRIKQSCTKNGCNQILSACFKNLQYFQKNQWKHLQRFILQQLGLQKKMMDQVQELRKNLQEKQNMIKKVIKENIQFRTLLQEIRAKETSHTQRNYGKLSQQNISFLQAKNQSLPINHSAEEINISKNIQPNFSKNKLNLPIPPKSKKIQIPEMPASLSKFLPKNNELPMPPNMKKKQSQGQKNIDKYKNQKPMRDRPKLQFIKQILTVQIQASKHHKKESSTTQLQISSSTQLNNNILPPPPTLGKTILPLPPVLGNTILPSPPNFGNNILPPPPTLGNTILPPPPTLGNTILPPPPTLGNTILPPPPTLGNTILPPPPTLGSTILPPPPNLGSTNLPTPPNFNNLLPSPPNFSSSLLPPPPSGGGLPNIGQVSNLGMPPGLGLMNTVAQKLKQKRRPKVPLKVCNYTTLTYEKIVDSVFEEIDDLKNDLNQEELVQLFCKNNIVSNNSKSNQQNQKSKVASQQLAQKQSVKLLSPQRFRNLEIILTKLRIPPGQLTKSLIECSGKFTSHSVLQSISKILPTQQQQQIIKAYQGSQQDLGKPQRFYKQLIEIPEYASRIKSLIFSNIKQEFYYELSSKIQQLQAGFSSLKQNQRFKYVLQMCLTIGNYLNGTTLKGGAWGFKIQTMQRLEQIKSSDNKTNAAFYLIKQVWKKYPYPIFQKQQIDLYQYLSKMPISQANQQIGQLNNYCKYIQKAFCSKDKNNQNDNIGAFCQQILLQTQTKLEQYKQALQKLNQIYYQCAKYYCQDGKKTPSDQFGKKMFQTILFISNTQKMFKVIEDRRLKDEARKPVKTEISYVQQQNPQSNKKQNKKPNQKIPLTLQSNVSSNSKSQQFKLPDIASKLPPPPPKNGKKQDKLKQIQKFQQQRQKKALQQVMMRRTSKLQAYRMSKMNQSNNNKKGLDEIDFLKGVN